MVNNEACHNTQVRCDIIDSQITAQGVHNIVPNSLVSTSKGCKEMANSGLDLKSVHSPTCSRLDTHASGRGTVKKRVGYIGQDLCNVSTSNRFSLLSQSDVCPDKRH